MKGQPAISPIYREIPSAPEDAVTAFCRKDRLRRQAWRQHGLVVAEPAELPPHLRTQIEAWADDQYGRRR